MHLLTTLTSTSHRPAPRLPPQLQDHLVPYHPILVYCPPSPTPPPPHCTSTQACTCLPSRRLAHSHAPYHPLVSCTHPSHTISPLCCLMHPCAPHCMHPSPLPSHIMSPTLTSHPPSYHLSHTPDLLCLAHLAHLVTPITCRLWCTCPSPSCCLTHPHLSCTSRHISPVHLPSSHHLAHPHTISRTNSSSSRCLTHPPTLVVCACARPLHAVLPSLMPSSHYYVHLTTPVALTHPLVESCCLTWHPHPPPTLAC